MNANVDEHLSAANTLALKFFLFDAPQTLVLRSFLARTCSCRAIV